MAVSFMAAKQSKPDSTSLRQFTKGNEFDYRCKGFELKAVSRSEFEALKRLGDYEELHD
jgi:hypothetical protein